MAGSNPCRAREPSKAKSSRGRDRFQEDLNAGRFLQDFVPLVFVAGVAFDGHVGSWACVCVCGTCASVAEVECDSVGI